MKPTFPRWHRPAKIVAQVLLLSALALTARADDTATNDVSLTNSPSVTAATNDDAEAAWHQVRKDTQAPMPPVAWQTHPPTIEERANFYSPLILKGAEDAKNFYTKYPNSPHAAEAHNIEFNMLSIDAENFGHTNQNARIEALTAQRLHDPNLSEDEKLEARLTTLRPLFQGLPGTADQLLQSARALKKDFPTRPEVYQVLLMVLMESEGENAKSLAQELAAGDAPEQVKAQAQELLKQMDFIGKPLDIQYTAVDGREVDLAKLKGKVVLVDFWATWCGPCMAEVPTVKAAYDKLHTNGFEIVGISFDHEKPALEHTLKEKEMTWPQYFNGDGENKYALEFGVNGIPRMWLVDKKGILRDINGRAALADKVSKLLEE